MATQLLIILADRGNMKAFEVEMTPTRGPAPRLIQTLQIGEAHGKFEDKFTDQAGAFPNGGTLGQGNSIAERMTLVAEIDVRIFRQLAGHITSLLRQYKPERWVFAAPSEINGAIIDGLAPDLRARLDRNVKSDLIHIDPADLLDYFTLPAS